MAWPNDKRPPKPISRLNAQAKRAKHNAFIRKTGYTPTYGATMKAPVIRSVATMKRRFSALCAESSDAGASRTKGSAIAGVVPIMFSALLAEKTGRLDEQHDDHDDEDHGVRC